MPHDETLAAVVAGQRKRSRLARPDIVNRRDQRRRVPPRRGVSEAWFTKTTTS
jgi:hypothetical protein